ncbi:hypothetical protein Trydic_g23191 [Trypoxylus dichotomus]
MSRFENGANSTIDRAQLETTGSPQAKSPAGSSSGAIPAEARTPTASNKTLQNVKGDHPSFKRLGHKSFTIFSLEKRAMVKRICS